VTIPPSRYSIPTPTLIPHPSGTLLLLDTLYPLLSHSTLNLPTFLLSLLTPQTTLLAIHHTDIPLPPPPSPYTPVPLTLLRYLATTIFTTYSLQQVLARKRAEEKSLPLPAFGIEEGRAGVLVGWGANGGGGVVVEMECRRKSGRGVGEWFFLPPVSSSRESRVILLDEHPLYRQQSVSDGGEDGKEMKDGGEGEMSTFDLGITERQRRVREGVVLPYFDAQVGGGEGGRILYDMGVEDDFDEEEDEI